MSRSGKPSGARPWGAYLPRPQNEVADYFSQLDGHPGITDHVETVEDSIRGICTDDLDRKQKNGSILQGVTGCVTKHWPRKGQLDVDRMQYFKARVKLRVENGRLYNENKSSPTYFQAANL